MLCFNRKEALLWRSREPYSVISHTLCFGVLETNPTSWCFLPSPSSYIFVLYLPTTECSRAGRWCSNPLSQQVFNHFHSHYSLSYTDGRICSLEIALQPAGNRPSLFEQMPVRFNPSSSKTCLGQIWKARFSKGSSKTLRFLSDGVGHPTPSEQSHFSIVSTSLALF